MPVKIVKSSKGEDNQEPMQSSADKLLNESDAIIAAINKQKGTGTVIRGSQIPMPERIPTGILEFDLMTGGGFPRSRMSIIFGPEGCGKTNHTLLAAACAQRLPAPCNKVVWIDLEGTLDPKWTAQLGVDTDKLIVVKPAYGEEALDIIDAFIRANDVALVVVDSLAALVSAKEMEGSLEKADIGSTALLAKRMSNKAAVALSLEQRRGHNPAVIFINRISYKIGVMFGNPETQPGGQHVKFNSSLTIRLSSSNKMDGSISAELPSFKVTKAVIKKAKVGVLRAETEYNFSLVDSGHIKPGETQSFTMVSNRLKELGILKKADKGGWELEGINFKTLVMIEDHYYGDDDYRAHLQELVINSYKDSVMLIEGEN